MEAPLLAKRILSQPPSCIATCPADPFLLVLGTYRLEEAQDTEAPSQLRSGRIEVYQILKETGNEDFGLSQCVASHGLPTSAVLDLHFLPNHDTSFAVCTSTCEMLFFSLDGIKADQSETSSLLTIRKLSEISLRKPEGCIATAFAWDPHPNLGLGEMSFAVTFSSGEVEVYQVSQTSETHFEACRASFICPPRSLEAWTASFISIPQNTEHRHLLSGGDDSILTLHTASAGTTLNDEPMTKVCQDSKCHSAGVTAILPIFQTSAPEPLFLTGSYDEHLRLFSIVNGKFKLIEEIRLGGGVWRLRSLSERTKQRDGATILSIDVLASCMHAGAQILRISQTESPEPTQPRPLEWEMQALSKFAEHHESMCYGSTATSISDLQGSSKDESQSEGKQVVVQNDFIVASTSFYDRKLCLWRWKEAQTT